MRGEEEEPLTSGSETRKAYKTPPQQHRSTRANKGFDGDLQIDEDYGHLDANSETKAEYQAYINQPRQQRVTI